MKTPLRISTGFIVSVLACGFLVVTDSDAPGRPLRQRSVPRPPVAAPPPEPIEISTPAPDVPEPLKIPGAQLEPASWQDLEGWAGDDHAAAYAALLASCRPLGRNAASRDDRPLRAPLAAACRHALAAGPLGQKGARDFFEENFAPVRINRLGETAGFLTGYYEPIVEGSRFPTQVFKVPVYRRPRDLLAPGKALDAKDFPNNAKSVRVTREGGQVPYYDRAEIEDGALDGEHLELCWIKDQTELLFMQIQGSARVRLEDGTMLRINYDSHNGYSYVPVGRVLIERNVVPREEMSMDRIRQWLAENPGGAAELRRQNRSFVFFRIVGLTGDNEPSGAQGVPLTPARSIAVDRVLHVYGTPFFIEAKLPGEGELGAGFARTMIAQDTGSAILGPARADIYFGAGDDAAKLAGRVRHAGRFTMLVPRDLDPSAYGARMPLPRPKPMPGNAPTPPQPPASGLAQTEVTPLPRPRPSVAPRSFRQPAGAVRGRA